MPKKPDNKFAVTVHPSGQISVLNPPLQARGGVSPSGQDTMPRWPAIAPLSPDEALNLAAWLVATAQRVCTGDARTQFNLLLGAIEAATP
jgi:hypothetical protein